MSELESDTKVPPKRRLGLIVAAVAAAGALIGGVRWYIFHHTHVVTDNAAVDGDLITISSKVSGRVEAILVADNTSVKAGTPLVQLERQDLLVARAKTQAAVAAALGALAEAKAALAMQQTQEPLDRMNADAKVGAASASIRKSTDALAKAQQDSAAAEVERASAARDLQRIRALAAQEAVSRQTLDTAEDRLQRAEAQVRATQALIAAARSDRDNLAYQQQSAEVGRRQADAGNLVVSMKAATVKRCEAQLAAAKADLADIDRKLDETIIKAPVDGRIGKRSVQIGQLISASEPLMSLIPPAVWVTANLKETEVEGLHPGANAEVTVDAFPDTPFTGTVQSFQPATGARFSMLPPDNATGNFTKVVQHVPVRIALKPQPHLDWLSPGLSVEVTIDKRGS